MAIGVHLDISSDFLKQFSSQVSEAVGRAMLSTGKAIQQQWEGQASANFGRTPPIMVIEDRPRHAVTVQVDGKWVVLQPLDQKTGGRRLLAESEMPGVRPRFFGLRTRLPRRMFKRAARKRYPLEIESPLTRGKRPGRFGFIDRSELSAIASREMQREVERLR